MVLFLRSKKRFRYIPDNESEQPVLGWNISVQGCINYNNPKLKDLHQKILDINDYYEENTATKMYTGATIMATITSMATKVMVKPMTIRKCTNSKVNN